MIISIDRAGGIAGFRRTNIGEFDTTKLDLSKAGVIEEIVDEIDFFKLPDKIAPSGNTKDTFEYWITITDEDRRHTVNFMDEISFKDGTFVYDSPIITGLQRIIKTLTEHDK